MEHEGHVHDLPSSKPNGRVPIRRKRGALEPAGGDIKSILEKRKEKKFMNESRVRHKQVEVVKSSVKREREVDKMPIFAAIAS